MKFEQRWRWKNFPLPEAHLALLMAGLVLHAVHPRRIARLGRRGRTAGAFLVLAGLTLAAGAVREAGDSDLERPDRVLVEGPYAVSRHPMYVGWTLMYLGLVVIVASAWLVLLLPALVALVRREAIREERRMEDRFGAAYGAYRSRVRRYF